MTEWGRGQQQEGEDRHDGQVANVKLHGCRLDVEPAGRCSFCSQMLSGS